MSISAIWRKNLKRTPAKQPEPLFSTDRTKAAPACRKERILKTSGCMKSAPTLRRRQSLQTALSVLPERLAFPCRVRVPRQKPRSFCRNKTCGSRQNVAHPIAGICISAGEASGLRRSMFPHSLPASMRLLSLRKKALPASKHAALTKKNAFSP